MPSLITVISTLAGVVGIVGILPQLSTMVTTRTADGQSPLGWLLGASANVALAFVNLCGYHATVLAAGNLISLAGCLTAVALIRRYGAPTTPTTPPAVPGPPAVISEMHTGELVALSQAVIAEHRRRAAERGDIVLVG
jgi:uncharacterized protein with PQ loop repeat